jgi:hypothetical protein
MWTVTIDQMAGAWCRRQAHDLTLHRWDAQHARGHAQPFHAERAADFTGELFEATLPYTLPFFGPCPNQPRAANGRRFVLPTHRRGHRQTTPIPDPDPAVATLTGTASDLLLARWRRPTATTVAGDPTAGRLATSHRRITQRFTGTGSVRTSFNRRVRAVVAGALRGWHGPGSG